MQSAASAVGHHRRHDPQVRLDQGGVSTGMNGIDPLTCAIDGPIRDTLTGDEIDALAKRPRGVWSDAFDGAKISETLRGAYE